MFQSKRWLNLLIVLTLLLGLLPAAGSTPRAQAVAAAPEDLTGFPQPVRSAPLAPAANDGTLDLSFDPGNGTGSSAYPHVQALALQPDGKIIIGGWFEYYNNVARNYLARVNTDGSLDTTFNSNSGPNSRVQALALQPDGKILIGGNFTTYNGTARSKIARLNPDGSLDTTFNPGNGADDWVYAIALQPDGKILIGGHFNTYNGVSRHRIARVNADGSLDTTFDPGTGIDGTYTDVWKIVLQPDGKILLGGDIFTYNGFASNYLARVNADGSLDGAFGSGSGANGRVDGLALQPDGKILIGGVFTTYDGVPRHFIARVNADGTLDTTFDPGSGADNTMYAFAFQPDGKILIGSQFNTYDGVARNGIARVNTDGSLDTTFDPGSGTGGVYALALQPDGKLLIVGTLGSYDGVARMGIARVYGYALAPALSKQVTTATADPGDTVTYTLRLSNLTTATLTSIVLTDTLPPEILNPQVSSNVTLTLRAGTRYVWDVADLAPGASAVIILTGQVSAVTTRAAIINTASFSSSAGAGQASATVGLPGVSVTKSGGGQGRVTSAPAGIDCEPACSRVFAVGTPITLTATPAPGSQFCGWYGAGGCSGAGPCTLTVNAYHPVEARFGRGRCDVTIGAVRNGDWANPNTWSAGHVPHRFDIVEIGATYTINAPAAPILVRTLYQDGILQSARNSALDLYVTQALTNTGTIRGQTGATTIGATCGAPGSDVILSGGTLLNSGTIQGGDGRGGGCCGGGGGDVALSFKTVNNTGLVAGGAGGNTGASTGGACCANPTAGRGGSVTVRAGDRNQGLRSSGDIRGGAGGDQAQCGGNHPGGCGGSVTLASQPIWVAWNAGNPLPTLQGGASGRNSNGTTGQCGGTGPDVQHLPPPPRINGEPNDLVISQTLVSSDDVLFFGGDNWVMDLSHTAAGFISATHGITLAVGAGGSIDLRGCEAGAFTAEKFFIASDNVILDAGKTLSDVVNAPVIEQTGAQILGDIAVSAPGYVRGLRGESLDIPIELVNNSPIAFTYDLAATSGSGLPSFVTIAPVSSTVVTLTVVAPPEGGQVPVVISATAQTSPYQSAWTWSIIAAPVPTASSTLSQTFAAGTFYPFTDTLRCGGVTFAQAWTGQVTVTMAEVAPPVGPILLPRMYTVTVNGAAPQATLALCYDESDVEGVAVDGVGIPSDTPLYLYAAGDWLAAERAAGEPLVTSAVALPGAWYIGARRFSLDVVKTGDGGGIVGGDLGGLSCGVTCTAEFWAQTPVQLEASPDPGHYFAGWSGAASGMQNPVTVTLDADKVVTARFTLNAPQDITHTLTLAVAGTGTGVVTPTIGVHVYVSGTVVTVTATPTAPYVFAGWSGDVDWLEARSNPLALTLDRSKALTATFEPVYTLTVHQVGVGVLNCLSEMGWMPCGPGVYSSPRGTVIEMSASNLDGSRDVFRHWSGAVVTTTPGIRFILTANQEITATFTPWGYALTVTPVGDGQVTQNPPPPPFGPQLYTAGSVVTLTAVPTAPMQFGGWTGACSGLTNPCHVTMDNDKTVTATFTLNPPVVYTLTIATTGTGSGVVTPTVGAHPYVSGTVVPLAATPAAGSTFAGWSGDADCADGSVTLDASKTCTAAFTLTAPQHRFYLPLVLR